jgi:hypothetical protein
VPQRLFTRIIMRVKVVCTLTHQLSLPHRRPSSRSTSNQQAARPGAAARRRNHRRRGSASTPSVASRREAFTRSGAGGSLDVGSAGTQGRSSATQPASRLREIIAAPAQRVQPREMIVAFGAAHPGDDALIFINKSAVSYSSMKAPVA